MHSFVDGCEPRPGWASTPGESTVGCRSLPRRAGIRCGAHPFSRPGSFAAETGSRAVHGAFLLLLLLLFSSQSSHAGHEPHDGPSASASALLQDEAADADSTVRARSLALLVELGPEWQEFALRGLFDPAVQVRRSTIEALEGRSGERDALDLLAQTALRPDVALYDRVRAAVIVAHHASREEYPLLMELWHQAQRDWEVAPLALPAAIWGRQDAIRAMVESFPDAVFPVDLRFALDLGQSGVHALIPVLEDLSGQLDEPEPALLGVALAELGSPMGEVLLRRSLQLREDGDHSSVLDAIDFVAGM